MIKQWLKNNFSFLLRNSWALMYHHIDEQKADPWDLTVQPDRFEEQLKWLKKNCHVLSVAEITEAWKKNRLKPHSVLLTFDDGYLNNYTHARPLLEKYELPATFFITTDNLLQQKPFWWDELQAIILENETLPSQLSLRIDGAPIEFDLGDEAELTAMLKLKSKQWRYPSPPDTKRSQLYYTLWQEMIELSATGQQQVILQLKDWAGLESVTCPGIMSKEQLIDLSRNPLFTIGAHTLTHPALGKLDREEQKKEMSSSREVLQDILKTEVRFLAYPYGSYNDNTLSLAKELGFEASFTTQSIPLQKIKDRAFLGRLPVTNEMNYRTRIR